MTEIKASIIIPTKDKINRLRLVLKALEGQVDDNIEVIIVFDGNKKETLFKFQQLNFAFEPVKVILENNVGRSIARNRGIREAKGKIIIMMDDDTVPCSDFVKNHLSGHKERCVLIGGIRDTFISETEIEDLYFDRRLTKDISFLNDRSQLLGKIPLVDILFKLFKNKNPLKWLILFTGNISLLKEDFIKAGGFDEGFKGWGHEDIELGYRLHKLGLPFYKDLTLTNYHLVHAGNHHSKLNESIINLRYIIRKHRKDVFIQTFIRYLLFKEYIRKIIN